MPTVSRHRTLRRLAAAVVTVSVLPAITLTAAPAQAATPFIVVGTSDVSDSNLMSAVIEPGFQAAYPQYDLQYVPKGTGAAITQAESGGAAALLVHAASLENQFVGGGWSLEPAGRAIFYGDYVLAGPASDPAGVLTGAPHDIVTAFEKIAAAGAANQANFVSRGGTPGTATQERAIWAMTGASVTKCDVGTGNGGGDSPSTSSTACPNLNTIPFPSWYHTGDSASQANNVSIANTCAFTNGNCYVFTDRGTFDYQQSIGNDANLKIVTRDNDPAARGGREDLINVFHAYGINPSGPGIGGGNSTDPTAATLFLNWITSPAAQTAIGNFLSADQPFVPAATPKMTGALAGGQTRVGKPSTITGHLTNPIPGYKPFANATVNLLQANSSSPLAIPTIVASATTDANGNYSIKHTLQPGKFYKVGVGSITQVENSTLSPAFSDTFSPTSVVVGTAAKVDIKSITVGHKDFFTVAGKLKPGTANKSGQLVLTAKQTGKKAFVVNTYKVKQGKTKFHVHGHLRPGHYKLQLTYQDGTSLIPAASAKEKVVLN